VNVGGGEIFLFLDRGLKFVQVGVCASWGVSAGVFILDFQSWGVQVGKFKFCAFKFGCSGRGVLWILGFYFLTE
jgi:hypothetical protein